MADSTTYSEDYQYSKVITECKYIEWLWKSWNFENRKNMYISNPVTAADEDHFIWSGASGRLLRGPYGETLLWTKHVLFRTCEQRTCLCAFYPLCVNVDTLKMLWWIMLQFLISFHTFIWFFTVWGHTALNVPGRASIVIISMYQLLNVLCCSWPLIHEGNSTSFFFFFNTHHYSFILIPKENLVAREHLNFSSFTVAYIVARSVAHLHCLSPTVLFAETIYSPAFHAAD